MHHLHVYFKKAKAQALKVFPGETVKRGATGAASLRAEKYPLQLVVSASKKVVKTMWMRDLHLLHMYWSRPDFHS